MSHPSPTHTRELESALRISAGIYREPVCLILDAEGGYGVLWSQASPLEKEIAQGGVAGRIIHPEGSR